MNNLEDFKSKKILIVGDVMLDHYLFGSTERISPEAPVPVVLLNSEQNKAGGAANVALNTIALGAETHICSIIGADAAGEKLQKILTRKKINIDLLLTSEDRKTTKKSRIIARNQQMLRIDQEDDFYLLEHEEKELLERLTSHIESNNFDVMILQDYNKGLLTKNVIKTTIDLAQKHNIKVAVDPKSENFFEYKNVDLFKPNLKEINEGLNLTIDPFSIQSLVNASSKLSEQLNNKITFITLSAQGVFISDHQKNYQIAAQLRNIADVSGAGDTVIAVAALALASDWDIKYIASLANLAGGLVCEEVGVATIRPKSLEAEWSKIKN